MENALDLTAPASDALLKNRKNAWVQLAGHKGAFAPAGHHTIWKKQITTANYEIHAYQDIMMDSIHHMVPRFYRQVDYSGQTFIELEDLLQHFTDPSIIDIKMGTRTFLESEVENPILRKDLYEKMIKLSPDEPTEAENDARAITKLRYMQFREQRSSSCTLGFRVEAICMSGEQPNTDLKKVKSRAEVKKCFNSFLEGSTKLQKKIRERLKDMRKHFENSTFFKSHEFIGSSLLMLVDRHDKVGVWMIDLAKCVPHPEATLSHRTEWKLGNHEDGYLFGLDNLIDIFAEPLNSEQSHNRHNQTHHLCMPLFGKSHHHSSQSSDCCSS